LTLGALVSMPAAGAAFAAIASCRWGAAGVAAALFVNWFGDSLDGTLARVRQQPRPRYGYYVDHVADLAGTASLVAGMAASELMHATIAGPPRGVFSRRGRDVSRDARRRRVPARVCRRADGAA